MLQVPKLPVAHLFLVMFVTACGASPHSLELPQAQAASLSEEEMSWLDSKAPTEPFDMVTNDTPHGDRFLRQRAQPVVPGDQALDALISRMRATVDKEQGVGIAAPQIGVSRRLVLVQRQDKAEMPFEAYLNPKVVSRSEETVVGWEGCLSVPAGYGRVERARTIRIEYEQLDGTHQSEDVTDWTARIFLHELDHLDGILFIDRMTPDALPLMPKDEYRAMRKREKEEEAEQAPPVEDPTLAPIAP